MKRLAILVLVALPLLACIGCQSTSDGLSRSGDIQWWTAIGATSDTSHKASNSGSIEFLTSLGMDAGR